MSGGGSKVSVLILAAGYSSRMGSFKPLLSLGRSTVLEEAVRGFLDAGLQDIRVVVGHRADEVRPLLKRCGVKAVFNPDFSKGMFSSIAAGVRDLEPDVEAFFLLPGDIPLVKSETHRALARCYEESRAGIVYPRFQNERGHPPIIATRIVRDSLRTDPEDGLRGILREHEHEALDMEVVDQGILMDCDTPGEYVSVRARASARNIPTERECEECWSRFCVSDDAMAHGRMVGELSRILALHLNRAGVHLDVALVTAAGNLHDLAKGRPDHARAGAEILSDLGYPQVAGIVAAHMNFSYGESEVDERGVVFLADKLVKGDRLVSLDERFGKSLEKFQNDREALNGALQRLQSARRLKERVEKILGMPLDHLLERHGRGICAAARSSSRVIYLARHGAIHVEGEGRRYIGQVDLPLCDEGIRQAEGLREKLRNIPISHIFCSDLRRTVQTAEIVAGPHGILPQPRSDLREIHLGRWESLTFEEVRRRFPEEFKARGGDIVHFRPPNGESFLDCAYRVMPALYEILHSTIGTVLIVGHAGVNRIILSQAGGADMEDLFTIKQDYGCLNAVTYHNYKLSLLNGSSHPAGHAEIERKRLEEDKKG